MNKKENSLDLKNLLPKVENIARKAGAVIESFKGNSNPRNKKDGSVITDADLAADALIIKSLKKLTPHIPIVTEENVAAGTAPDIKNSQTYWMIDPLDGTRCYVAGRDGYCVNIGLIHKGEPVLGVIYIPSDDTLYAAAGIGTAIMKKGNNPAVKISASDAQSPPYKVVSSRTFKDAPEFRDYIQKRGYKSIGYGTAAQKFGMLAAGEFNLYPRFGGSGEWDIVAGHAIVNAAGGSLMNADGTPMRYGKPSFENGNFVAAGKGYNHKPQKTVCPKP